ncbi:asparagine synthase (glutamine-hydrolyzing) [Candidatus Daviesbacteria bacterium]|nr:asparagine synthase (glutamine-hydrolyzing) [Candidatus Daviesbacteria bacterium]
MCGVVGYAGFRKRVSLKKAIEAISHRGPDDHGGQYFDGVALGNTRLSIIDLSSKGHQPMFNQDKTLCITFNGEIYNFNEIKKLLEKKYHFVTQTDTEVILYSYQEWGVKCLEKLNGMFSFVIFDRKNNLLFGARDRLGQKPLKYYINGGKFIFASEIKAIMSLLAFKPDIDNVAIDDFLTLQYVPAPKTGFEDIYKLPSGHFFLYKENKLSIHRYWSLNFGKKLNLSDGQWCDLVFDELEKCVKSHLISDVPVGVLLSGGLDSSIIVSLMSKFSSQRINTFSIGFNDKRFDESGYAKLVSRLYKTSHTQLNVTDKDLITNIDEIGEIYDEPISDNSILPTMLISKLASSKVKVALTGDGGDENFAGYDRYTIACISKLFSKLPKFIKKSLLLTAKSAHLLYESKQTERMARFMVTLEDSFYRRYVNYNSFFTNKVKSSLYTNFFKETVNKNDTFEIFHKLYDKNLDILDNALKFDINTYLPDDLLYKTDSASMAFGLELRSPFLDHALMEKVAAMPSDKKFNLITKKKILKEIALRKKLLPQEIIYRSKHGFNIPQNKWFKGKLKNYLINKIMNSSMVGKIFEKQNLKVYLDNYFNTNLSYDNNIFALLILALWMDKYHN